MLVLNTNNNQWWWTFEFSNSFMKNYNLDVSNSIIMFWWRAPTTTIDWISCTLSEDLLFPYCLVWNNSWAVFWPVNDITISNAWPVQFFKAWTYTTWTWYEAESFLWANALLVSNFVFTWWEVVWKQVSYIMLCSILWRWSFYKAWSSDTPNFSNYNRYLIAKFWLLRNWVLLNLWEAEINNFTTSTYGNNRNFGGMPTRSVFKKWIVETEWITAESWDRLYVQFFIRIKMKTSTTFTIDSWDYIWDSRAWTILFWQQWWTYINYSSDSYTINYFAGSSSSNTTTKTYYNNYTWPINYIQFSVD